MGILREDARGDAQPSRLRASLRGVLPAAVTLLVLLVGFEVVEVAAVTAGAVRARWEPAVSLTGTAVLYALAVVLALSVARRVGRRVRGAVDRGWVRRFAAGVAISALALAVSLAWAVARGHRSLDPGAAGVTGPGGRFVLGGLVVTFVALLLVQHVYEEVVFRELVLGNFVEGLTARGFSPGRAAVPATLASTVLFGLYHLPLRGTVVVVVDAALVGVTFSLAYLLTDDLGLPVGVHFGRAPLELLFGAEFVAGYEVVGAVELTRDTLAANLEVTLLRLGLTCVLVLVWVRLTGGDLEVAESVYDRS